MELSQKPMVGCLRKFPKNIAKTKPKLTNMYRFFKQKRFFYFQDEAISEDKLKTYLHKDTASLSTAAYASQTGKGLLLYSKGEGQRENPHGIIKMVTIAIYPLRVTLHDLINVVRCY